MMTCQKEQRFDCVAFGHAIKSRRAEIGVTQKQLAELIGLSRLSVQYYEKAKQEPSIGNYLKLTNWMNASATDFVTLR